jgi:hypothetical protein
MNVSERIFLNLRKDRRKDVRCRRTCVLKKILRAGYNNTFQKDDKVIKNLLLENKVEIYANV